MNTSYVGELEGFFECIACEDCAVNVLSQSDVEDKFPLTFNPGHSYIVHTPMKDVVFLKKNKMYVADFSDWINPEYKNTQAQLSLMTADEREHLYTKKEVKRALEAKEFIKNAGYPSLKEAVHLAQDGNIIGMPQTATDITRYYDIYGPPVEAIRGMTTNKKVGNIVGIGAPELREQRTRQELVMDIMFLAKENS